MRLLCRTWCCVWALLIGSEAWSQTSKAEFTVYQCQHETAVAIEGLLRPLLTGRTDVQLVVDAAQNRILIQGDAEIQRLATQLLERVDQPRLPAQSATLPVQPGAALSFPNSNGTAGPAPPRPVPWGGATPGPLAPSTAPVGTAAAGTAPMVSAPPATTVPAAAQPTYARYVSLTPDQWNQLRQLSPLSEKLTAVAHPPQGRAIWTFQLRDRSVLEFEYDQQRRGLLVAGPQPVVDQLIVLIQALHEGPRSVPAPTAGVAPETVVTRVIRLPREVHGQAEQMLRAGGAKLKGTIPAGNAQGALSPANVRRAGGGVAAVGGVAPVSYLYQDAGSAVGGGPATAQAPSDPATTNPNDPQNPPGTVVTPGGQFEGVEIETLPDLDVIILRGRDHELNQLTEIIEQLERISQQTQPVVTIVNLQHARSDAVAEIIDETSPDLVGGRQGRVSVTPLVKPNSLLLVGWGDAVQAILELIRQLDTPVDPASQVEVFRLRFASPTAVQLTLNTFFANRDGLGAQIRSTIDARTNSLIVYAAPRDLLEVQRIIAEIDTAGSAAVNQARIYTVQHALAADLAETLQQAISAAQAGDRSAVLELQSLDENGKRILQSGTLDGIQITPNPRNNTLLISSPAESMELVTELIRQLDSPAAKVQIKVFQVQHSDAAALIQTLRSLLPSQTGATSGLQLPSGAGETSLAPLRFSLDERSNSIIATGSEGDLRIVQALLTKLDQSSTQQRKSIVYQLKNSPAIDVANAVNLFLQSKRVIENATPGASSPFQDIEREVVVVPEPIANKLILSATPRYFEEINALIEKLDEQPPQVMIQVLIAEVALNNTDEFGVELGLQDSVLFDRSLLGDLATTVNTTQTSTAAGVVTTTQEIIQSATNVPGFNFNNTQPLGNSGSNRALESSGRVGGQGISNFAVGRGNDQLGFGGLVLSASSQNVSVLLRALQESRRVRVLSRPQVRTLDNQPAFIQVGQRVPRIIGSNVNQNGQSNSVALENVGLILGVTPRISPDGTVVMEIDAEKSSLGPEQEGVPVAVSVDGTIIRSPRVDTTTAQATVSAASGETIVLGGLITKSTEEIHRQVPFLGDIPLLGNLFRYDGTASRRTELLIILSPHVIRSPADSERVRQAEMARMSWCAADVHAIHGDVGLADGSNVIDYTLLDWDAPPTIYPDLNPSGDPTAAGNSSGASRLPASAPLPRQVPPLNSNELPTGELPADDLPAGEFPAGAIPERTRALDAPQLVPASP